MPTYTTYITAYNQIMVTAGYPYYPQSFGGGYHRGIDTHTPGYVDNVVRAPTDAVIVRSEYGTGQNSSWGNFVAGYNEEGNYTWLAAHFAARYVEARQTVKAGDPIGYAGQTGNASGVHTHWEGHRGRGITNNLFDPSSYLGFPNAVGTYDVEWGDPENPPGPGPDPPEPTPIPVPVRKLIELGIVPILTQLQSQNQLSQMVQYDWLRVNFNPYGGTD